MQELPSPPDTITTRLGEVALQLAAEIEQVFGEDAGVGKVIVVAEAIVPQEDGSALNPIVYASNEARRWIQAALLREALDEAEAKNQARVEEVLEALSEDDEDD